MTDDGLDMITVSFRCPRRLWDKVREYATRDDRPYSSVIRIALGRMVGASPTVRVPGRPPASGAKVQCLLTGGAK